jgi:hypothetical protein
MSGGIFFRSIVRITVHLGARRQAPSLLDCDRI